MMMSVEASKRLLIKYIKNTTSDIVFFLLSLHSVIKITKVLMPPEIV